MHNNIIDCVILKKVNKTCISEKTTCCDPKAANIFLSRYSPLDLGGSTFFFITLKWSKMDTRLIKTVKLNLKIYYFQTRKNYS